MSGGTVTSTAPRSRSYVIELGQHRCIALLREFMGKKDKQGQSLVEQDPVTGCVRYTGPTNVSGHWQIQLKPRYKTSDSTRASAPDHRTFFTHRIAFVAMYGVDIQETGSHLCGCANCFNPYHIHDESQKKNNDRQRCLGFIVCPQHNHVLAKLCPHDPPCIKPPVHTTQCCLLATQVSPSVQHPTPIIQLPPVQHINAFLNATPNLPESQELYTSEDSAEDILMSSDQSQEESESQQLPEMDLSTETILNVPLASSSQDTDFRP